MLGCVTDFDASNGVSVLQDGFEKLTRQLPAKVLPPLRVTALITPPEKRPYSALMPEVTVWTSCMASSMNRLNGAPSRLSLTSTPFTRKIVSNAKAPLTDTCPAFGVTLVNPGDSSAMPDNVRETASCSTSG